jgi:hypothetical protein
VKYIIRIGIPAAVVAVLGVIGLVWFLTAKELRYGTQAALLRAVPTTAADELRARGVRLASPLSCASMPEATKKKMRVACTGKTLQRQPIEVIASGESKTQDHYYTILVNGRPLVQNAGCLGADCKKKD